MRNLRENLKVQRKNNLNLTFIGPIKNVYFK